MWHASVAYQTPQGIRPIIMLAGTEKALMWRAAQSVLAGVGDAAAGEWRERLERSLHLKRRLTAEEWGGQPWGIDYRGTPEGWNRLNAVAVWLPGHLHEYLMRELIGATP